MQRPFVVLTALLGTRLFSDLPLPSPRRSPLDLQGYEVGAALFCPSSRENHRIEILEDFLQEGAFELCHEVQHYLENGREVHSRPRKGACPVAFWLERGPWGLEACTEDRPSSALQEGGSHVVSEEQSKAMGPVGVGTDQDAASAVGTERCSWKR